MVVSYYDKIIEVLKAGKILDAQKYFEKGKREKSLRQEEIEKLDKLALDWGALILQECLVDPKLAHNFYRTLQRVTGWDDETLGKQLNISTKSLENVRNLKLRSSKVIENMIVGLYRFLKII